MFLTCISTNVLYGANAVAKQNQLEKNCSTTNYENATPCMKNVLQITQKLQLAHGWRCCQSGNESEYGMGVQHESCLCSR
jgi:hypothetical protein